MISLIVLLVFTSTPQEVLHEMEVENAEARGVQQKSIEVLKDTIKKRRCPAQSVYPSATPAALPTSVPASTPSQPVSAPGKKPPAPTWVAVLVIIGVALLTGGAIGGAIGSTVSK